MNILTEKLINKNHLINDQEYAKIRMRTYR